LRRIWELPSIYMFRSDYLPVVAGTSPICDELCRRFLNFIAILVILNLFVLLLSMLSYYVREYLSVVITCCVTRDMASRWRVNLGLVSNLRAACSDVSMQLSFIDCCHISFALELIKSRLRAGISYTSKCEWSRAQIDMLTAIGTRDCL